VRAVFECSTPVISAVGHETDTTLTDYAADLRAPTTSAAAELATVDVRALLYTLEEYKLRLNRKMTSKMTKSREQLSFLSVRLGHASPQYALQQKAQYLADSEEKMRRLLTEKLKERRQELALLAERLHALTPVERLKGGYAYVTVHEKPLSSVAQVKPGSKISVTLRDGTIEAEVMNKNVNDMYHDSEPDKL
jgi:exodeoxyribonuclease VII large subunit